MSLLLLLNQNTTTTVRFGDSGTEAPLSSSFVIQVQVFWETPYNVVVEHPNPRAFMARTLKHDQNPWGLDS